MLLTGTDKEGEEGELDERILCNMQEDNNISSIHHQSTARTYMCIYAL